MEGKNDNDALKAIFNTDPKDPKNQPGNNEQLHERAKGLKNSAEEVLSPSELSKKSTVAKKCVGVDIGTSRIVSATTSIENKEVTQTELNAFFTLPYAPLVQDLLDRNKMNYIKNKDHIVVFGFHAQSFANMFNGELSRPMQNGLIKADEPNAISMIKEIIGLVVKKPDELGRRLCFSVPAPKIGAEADLIFHEAILKKYFIGVGYNASSVNEGLAVVLSELAQEDFTGIGVCIGAGMTNVCFSFLSVPVVVFGLHHGGDHIDTNVSRVVNEAVTRVRVIKEESLDLSRSPRNNMEQAFNIYYDDLISKVVNILSSTFSMSSNLPKLNKPIPLVLAGGTCIPNGFKMKFDKMLRQVELPIEISETKIATDPLRATARGALVYAGKE
ncbi:MAG: hypothetical protein HQK49_04570 [Oligoflexia bacterium]|nr:hypothetical protein [Oligoflexia bacterium]